MTALKSLDAHNAERGFVLIPSGPRLNGIACPKCGAELFDSDPSITLTSLPPQKHVHCAACDYRGTAYA